MKRERKVKYIVEYGNNLSVHKAYSWADAADFIKHWIDDGGRIRGVRRA